MCSDRFMRVPLLLMSLILPCTIAAGQEQPVLRNLDEAASWIKENISFPEDACDYGYVGTERFVISADWEGRVFITSNLLTLNPAFERAIIDVVGRCPKCGISGMMIEDIYRSVDVNFAEYIPEESRGRLIDVSLYASPRFVPSGSYHGVTEDSRDVFYGAVASGLKLRRGMSADIFPCTLSVRYTISSSLEDISVAGHDDDELIRAIEKRMHRVRNWIPAMTSSRRTIPIEVSDRLVADLAEDGSFSLTRYKDPVLLNSPEAPDGDEIVLVPDVPARIVGDSDIAELLKDSIHVDRPTHFIGSFVVEKDGSISNLYTKTSDSSIDSSLTALVNRSRWTPAMLGGVPVRSVHRFRGQIDTCTYEYVTGYIYYGAYPSFLSDGRRHSLVYDNRRSKAYRKIVSSYPSLEADVYGYGKFRYFDHNAYIEALMVKGKVPVRKVVVKKKKRQPKETAR